LGLVNDLDSSNGHSKNVLQCYAGWFLASIYIWGGAKVDSTRIPASEDLTRSVLFAGVWTSSESKQRRDQTDWTSCTTSWWVSGCQQQVGVKLRCVVVIVARALFDVFRIGCGVVRGLVVASGCDLISCGEVVGRLLCDGRSS